MPRSIYHVSYDACTDVEPRPGWYVGTDNSVDVLDDEITGPFATRTEAEDWLDEQMLPIAAE